jgi:hypothetical protein
MQVVQRQKLLVRSIKIHLFIFIFYLSLRQAVYFLLVPETNSLYFTCLWVKQFIFYLSRGQAVYILLVFGSSSLFFTCPWDKQFIFYLSLGQAVYILLVLGTNSLFCTCPWDKQFILYLSDISLILEFIRFKTAEILLL